MGFEIVKPSKHKLGHKIQQYLLARQFQVENLASQMGITPDGLSNLIHGRRRFKDDTLAKLSNTPIFQEGDISLARLKAYRAMDDYTFEELILALLEYVRQGQIDQLSPDFFETLRQELARGGMPSAVASKQHALLELMQQDAQ